MNILTFTYTKNPNEVSERVLVVSAEPNKMYKGTDISGLDQEDQAMYLGRINAAKETYLDAVRLINDEFDLNHNFRQFDPAKMANIVREEI